MELRLVSHHRVLTLVTGLVALTAGCAEPQTSTVTSTTALGISKLSVDENASVTTIVGVDAQGQEVARVELVHARFTLTPPFTEDYVTPEVDGRKLDISVQGQQMHWQTAGFEPVLELPAPPNNEWAITMLLQEPIVHTTLARWQIGFALAGTEASATEAAFTTITDKGDSPLSCAGASTCGTAYNGTVNTCGAGGSALGARRVNQHAGTNCGLYTSSYSQALLSQCCPAGTGGQVEDWFAQKACPLTSSNSTSCGTRSAGACKACPTYPAPADACMLTQGTTVGSCGGAAVYPMTSKFWATICEMCDEKGKNCCESATSYYCSPYQCP